MLNGAIKRVSGSLKTQILDGYDGATIEKAVAILRAGGLVAFPTETVYGLGADGLNPNAVAGIYEAKGRPPANPLILHVADMEAARPLVAYWPDVALKLTEKFWPGPLTIILPASSLVPDIVRAGNPTIALRSPNHPVALELLRAFNGPLAAPSANKTTQTSPTKPEHVLNGMGGHIDLILDGGRTTSGIESTIINLAETPPRLLRPGPICPMEIEAITGDISRFEGAVSARGFQAAPGMTQRHYAPKARLTVHLQDELIDVQREIQQISGERVILVVLGDGLKLPCASDYRRLPDDPKGASAKLYATLHDLDSEGYQRILFQAPPKTDEWLAIRDRLARAASKD